MWNTKHSKLKAFPPNFKTSRASAQPTSTEEDHSGLPLMNFVVPNGLKTTHELFRRLPGKSAFIHLSRLLRKSGVLQAFITHSRFCFEFRNDDISTLNLASESFTSHIWPRPWHGYYLLLTMHPFYASLSAI